MTIRAAAFAKSWENGVNAHWNDKGYFSDGTTLYKVKFDFNFVTSGEHQVVTVHDEEGRIDMTNWYTVSEGWEQSYMDETAAHEVGHMFGLNNIRAARRSIITSPSSR